MRPISPAIHARRPAWPSLGEYCSADFRRVAGKGRVEGLPEIVGRKQRRIRNSARKRDDVRPVEQLQQLADLGRLHAGFARGEAEMLRHGPVS
jgi:hypothetical protein